MTTMTTMEVTKTLVIGLGSTGTRVCNNLMRRLKWEYGDADKAPWVQFMAIETNNKEEAEDLRDRGDFFPINLYARQYSQLLAEPPGSPQGPSRAVGGHGHPAPIERH